ncbi:amylo-alpha-1,6-glucosidase [Streptomyces sp. NBC_01537]|uniref:glycogen debranching N-terminal domain-containing protein n=1 Tax=Streptomyces sp. NBC_01537 TaxID=2903896 RepID=UPI003866B369
MAETPPQQPYLHDLLCAVRAPAVALSGRDGGIAGSGVNGVFVNDRRILSVSAVELQGAELTSVLGEFQGAGTTRALLVARGLGDNGADPTVWVERRRELLADRVRETVEIRSAARVPVTTSLTLTLRCDLAAIADVKTGRPATDLPAAPLPDGLTWSTDSGDGGPVVEATARPLPAGVAPAGGRLSWPVALEPGQTARFTVDIVARDPDPSPVLDRGPESVIADITVDSADPRLALLVEQSLADLRGLELRDAADPDDHFIAAGAPWFLTLFGRDSLITARMLLPLGTRLAAGTLRALARRQGAKVDLPTAEEPGKILHEIRRETTEHQAFTDTDQQLSLPPVYYGTVDATPLWITLLHDAWRWGMPEDEVAKLLDPLTAALAWMRDHGQNEAGFLSYVDSSGHGLANQGWKDSNDSIQFNDGRLAQAPLALSEVQGYAYQAAICGAALLDAFGRPGGDSWRSWAAELSARFREHFWITDPTGRFPAVALDAQGTPVDSVASNMGHLLGTGILDAEESAAVVARLGSPTMSSGYGLRTMATSAAGYNPLSYHGGSVWTHDTALTIHGLGLAAAQGVPGAAQVAAALIDGILDAAPGFHYRMPELHGGEPARRGGTPTPYPASCRPQAWAAASSITLLTTLLGITPDLPGATLRVRPLRETTDPGITVRGLLIGEHRIDV